MLAKYYSGESSKEQLLVKYVSDYKKQVSGKAPDNNIAAKFFRQGLDAISSLTPARAKILAIEDEVRFNLKERSFIGFIDLVTEDEDGNISIIDHKSKDLKRRSSKGRYTLSDKTLDEYLRQLYLYSIPVSKKFGVSPKFLTFNCYRTGEVIQEPFSEVAFEEAKAWAESSVQNIIGESNWEPCIDYYYCKYICDVHNDCEYYSLYFGKPSRGRR